LQRKSKKTFASLLDCHYNYNKITQLLPCKIERCKQNYPKHALKQQGITLIQYWWLLTVMY